MQLSSEKRALISEQAPILVDTMKRSTAGEFEERVESDNKGVTVRLAGMYIIKTMNS